MKQLGIIGYPLSHSFSKKYFTEKFKKEGIAGYQYEQYELPAIDQLPDLIASVPGLLGLNVTIPHKLAVREYLHAFDQSAEKVGAVNVIKIKDGRTKGYNTDYYGFKGSLEEWIKGSGPLQALVLGVGGAARAVYAALEDLGITYIKASRDSSKGDITYADLKSDRQVIDQYKLIVNTTPLGTYPNVEGAPDLPYAWLGRDHFLYDLVYNPAITRFMRLGMDNGAHAKNGLQMLELQAEKSWEIWNSPNL